jgi:hypothetical protein
MEKNSQKCEEMLHGMMMRSCNNVKQELVFHPGNDKIQHLEIEKAYTSIDDSTSAGTDGVDGATPKRRKKEDQGNTDMDELSEGMNVGAGPMDLLLRAAKCRKNTDGFDENGVSILVMVYSSTWNDLFSTNFPSLSTFQDPFASSNLRTPSTAPINAKKAHSGISRIQMIKLR